MTVRDLFAARDQIGTPIWAALLCLISILTAGASGAYVAIAWALWDTRR